MIVHGRVLSAGAGEAGARIPGARVGDSVSIHADSGNVSGTVSSLRDGVATVRLRGCAEGLRAGHSATIGAPVPAFTFGTAALGRAIDSGLWTPPIASPLPHERSPIAVPLWTGVRAIDGLLSIGRGARVGVFGSPGCGKSTLLQTIALNAESDALVVALIGERGREAEEWLRLVPPHGSVVCATSDRAPNERVQAARVAIAQAHALRKRGLHVLLVVDSLARFGNALRELGVTAREPVGRGGYPSSVFAELAAFLEAAGTSGEGSITVMASVLSDGDERDPLSDAARSLLDGHLELSAAIAAQGRFPAIDVLASASRTMPAVISIEHQRYAAAVRGALAALERTRDARSLGIVSVEDSVTRAVAAEAAIEQFLRQDSEAVPFEATLDQLSSIASVLEMPEWT